MELTLVSPEVMDRLKNAAAQGLFVEKALSSVVPQFHARAVELLSGPNQVTGPKGRKRSTDPGQYPVNVVAGHLRRSQRAIPPGQRGLKQTQFALVNSAVYAGVVHDGGRGMEPRPFILQSIWEKAPDLESALARELEAGL